MEAILFSLFLLSYFTVRLSYLGSCELLLTDFCECDVYRGWREEEGGGGRLRVSGGDPQPPERAIPIPGVTPQVSGRPLWLPR